MSSNMVATAQSSQPAVDGKDIDIDLELNPQLPNLEEDEKYSAFPTWKKSTILFIVSWMGFVTVYSSTSLLTAAPEIAEELSTTVEIINITNAAVLIAMGSSSFIWGPISEIIGRKHAYNSAISLLFLCSIGAALAPNIQTFTAMRVLGGISGTFFLVAGQTIIADIFEPTFRGTAVGFFMIGTVSGPAIGPCIGGIVVNFTSWRMIYWLQVAMGGLGLVLSLLFVPDIQQVGKQTEDVDENQSRIGSIFAKFNPMQIIRPLAYPNVLLGHLSCGFLAVYQYTLLTSVRSVINHRFGWTSPLESGLFYIAPGAGFLIGSVLGGKFSDMAVKRYIIKRGGVRLPQDRLNSGLVLALFVLPVSALVYGWTLEAGVDDIAVPILSAFTGGASMMGTFNGLNTYAAEVLPQRRSQVISGKYIIQYTFSAVASAAALPLINAIGVGLTFTISTVLVISCGLLVLIITRRGIEMQKWAGKQ